MDLYLPNKNSQTFCYNMCMLMKEKLQEIFCIGCTGLKNSFEAAKKKSYLKKRYKAGLKEKIHKMFHDQ